MNVSDSSRSGSQPTKAELSEARRWAGKYLSAASAPPFSFVYGGRPSREIIGRWKRSCKENRIDAFRRQRVITCADTGTGLAVTCEATVFDDYPAVEWVLYFKNRSKKETPILENIFPLNVTVTRGERRNFAKALRNATRPWESKIPASDYPLNEFVLHRWRGCMNRPEDYAPETEVLPPGGKHRLFSIGGRSSGGNDALRQDGSLPFFNIEAIDEGVIVAVGWTGQWLAQFERDGGKNLTIRAGMELTHLKLLPGEKIRTPRILLFFWKLDRIAGHNKFRQFILDHHTPRYNNEPVQVPFAACGWFQFNCGNGVTEKNQIDFVRLYVKKKIPLEHFWIDAGWYGKKGDWGENVGNWFPKKKAFPRGLKPVADEVRKHGMGFFLWFEPERVQAGTQLCNEHPEWLFVPTGEMNKTTALLNLGNPEARKWLTDYISGMITELGMTVYRQDMNFDPLLYWRSADQPDRQGISEIRHIEGLYAFWDELLRRHKGLLIDNCANGNKRLDLETVSRSICIWRSDFTEPAAVQSHGYGLSLLIPTTGGTCHFFNRTDSYVFRSGLANGMTPCWDVRSSDFDEQQALKAIKEFKLLRSLFYGDFYGLTKHSSSRDTWLAYQIHREDLRRGALLVFRRRESPYSRVLLRFSGLKPHGKYELTDMDTIAKRVIIGKNMMSGMEFTLSKAESSQLIVYREMNKGK